MTTATTEDIQELRRDLERLREVVETLTDSEAGIRGALQEVQTIVKSVPTKVEFVEHIRLMDKKLDDDLKKVKKHQAELEGDIAKVKSMGTTHPHVNCHAVCMVQLWATCTEGLKVSVWVN